MTLACRAGNPGSTPGRGVLKTDSQPATDFYRSQTELAKEQIKLLKKQEEFIELQKKDLFESKKNRESIKQFTFVLAFGVIATIFFNLFQIFVQFNQSNNIHLLVISAIFIFLFLLYIGFIFHIFPFEERIYSYWKKNPVKILFIIIAISVLIWLLLTVPNFTLS